MNDNLVYSFKLYLPSPKYYENIYIYIYIYIYIIVEHLLLEE